MCSFAFHISAFVLVARTEPFLCFYHDGYVELKQQQAPHASHAPVMADLAQHGGGGLHAAGVAEQSTSGESSRERLIWTFDQVCDLRLKTCACAVACQVHHTRRGTLRLPVIPAAGPLRALAVARKGGIGRDII